MKRNRILALLVMLALIAGVAYATGVTTSWTSSDVREVNYLTPGAQKTQLGTRLQGVAGITGTGGIACSTSYVSCNTVATTATKRFYFGISGASYGISYALADGVQNQTVTFNLKTDGGKDLIITPTTKTGFTNATLNDANDSVTMQYIDDTTGWVITGNSAATIN